MTQLRFESLIYSSSSLGPENPLPPLINQRELHAVTDAPGVPQEILDNLNRGDIPSILPYTVQDGYDRNLRETSHKVAILENDHLRVTFLLELGGRLWSLIDKHTGRELLYRNEAIQFANLALRNAWFAGGVEWNCGIVGHSPFTCSPLFAARVGDDVLRLYEYERLRGVLYQLDFSLPAESRFLFVTVTIRNPHDRDIPMYWWSNIAVPQLPGTRVLVPATRSYVFGYQAALGIQNVPEFSGTDVTYPIRAEWPQDYFFDILPDRRKWIAAVDDNGYGLVQTSTRLLQGRKLFLWGTGESGSAWQRMLSPLGGEYLEIQAGLAKTQLEYVLMPVQTRWSWTEAYGAIAVEPKSAHGPNWMQATRHAEDQLAIRLPDAFMDEVHAIFLTRCDLEPTEVVHNGSGWGFLEQERRRLDGESPLPNEGLPFPESSVGPSEQPWLDSLRTGNPISYTTPSPSFMVQPEWQARLMDSPYHLGVLEWNSGDRDAARDAWMSDRSPWSYRNLAVYYQEAGDVEKATECYQRALELAPRCLPLVIEYARLLLATRPAECVEFVKARLPLPDGEGKVRAKTDREDQSRLRLIQACAAMEIGRIDIVQSFFDEVPIVTDLREGESTYDDLWRRFHGTDTSLFGMTPKP